MGSFPIVGVNEQQRRGSLNRGEAGSEEGAKLIVCGRLQVTVDGPTFAPASDAVLVGSCRGGGRDESARRLVPESDSLRDPGTFSNEALRKQPAPA